jgi:hypothetical protein
MLQEDAVAELVPYPAERPFLGEGVIPVFAGRPGEGADVLDHSGFLVIGLLEEEAVVLDLRCDRPEER